MNMPLLLGEDSIHRPFTADLTSLPHLFLSYSHALQSQQLLSCWLQHLAKLHACTTFRFSVLCSRGRSFSIPPAAQACLDVLAEGEAQGHRSLVEAWKELKKRQQLIAKGASASGFPLKLLWLDDVLQLIITRRRQTGMAFLHLLMGGHTVRMHLVAASSFTYRNLLRQLAQLHPTVQQKLRTAGSEAFQVTTPLGAEMVITADDLVYFKRANDITYERLYLRQSMTAAY